MDMLSFLFDIEMSVHGWIALALTVVGVVGLHLWLMRLTLKPWDPEAPGDDGGQDAPSANGTASHGGWRRRGQP